MAASLGSLASLGRWHHLHASDPVAAVHTDVNHSLLLLQILHCILMTVHD